MQTRVALLVGIVCLMSGLIVRTTFLTPPLQAQEAAPAIDNPAATIRAQTRLVLVDTIVTDKKGNYVRDLEAKDFRVWEDNKEQPIKSFSFESDEGSPANPQKRYLVLFFDNSTMDASDQMRARQAAAKFIDDNAGPNHLIAVVDFGGSLHIAQNFTADAERLKKVVAGVKFSSTSPNAPVEVASLGMPTLGSAEADFGIRSVMLALRSMAKNLASVQGRKSLVFLTSGFPMTSETESELTATIDSCNKANVAVYPIDVRGLVAPANVSSPQTKARPGVSTQPPLVQTARLHYVGRSPLANVHLVYTQHGTGGGGGGGGHAGGGPGGGGGVGGGRSGGGGGTGGHSGAGSGAKGGVAGGRGAGGGSVPSTMMYANPYNQPRQIVPPIPPSTADNQQVLYALAEGTGGFVIVNSNDLLAGMEKIAHDQGQYYVLGYTPPDSPEGSCHTLRVKIDRGGTVVRSRSGYCNVKPVDLLAGKPEEKDLENRAKGSQSGNISATMAAPFFYTGSNSARVDLAMEIPSERIQFQKEKGKQHAGMNVLGIAIKQDGSVAARFSDTVNLDFDDKKQVEEFRKQPLNYENQFEIAPGQYTLKVVFSSGGESFGKTEVPLNIEAYSAKQFTMSSLALSKELHRVTDMSTGLDAQLLEDRTPLVAQGMQIIPTASTRFRQTEPAVVYVEIYEPLLLASAASTSKPKIGILLDFVDRKTGQNKMAGKFDQPDESMREGNPVVPLGLRIPVDKLGPGSYELKLQAVDSAGNSSQSRIADFEVE